MSTYRVIARVLELRAGPGTGYEVLEQLPSGTELEQVPPSPHWTKVRRVSDGRIGWVYNAYIRPTQPDPSTSPQPAKARPRHRGRAPRRHPTDRHQTPRIRTQSCRTSRMQKVPI